MRVLALAASLRQESLNRKLLRLAIQHAQQAGAEVVEIDFGQVAAPNYDGDFELAHGQPREAQRFIDALRPVDGLLIASPEYNYSLPGTLKNLIDWASRAKPMPLSDKSALLLAASPSLVGGVRGLWQLRIPLEGLKVHVYPDMFALAAAHEAFDEQGQLRDASLAHRLKSLVDGYVSVGTAIARTRP